MLNHSPLMLLFLLLYLPHLLALSDFASVVATKENVYKPTLKTLRIQLLDPLSSLFCVPLPFSLLFSLSSLHFDSGTERRQTEHTSQGEFFLFRLVLVFPLFFR